jgi:UDPglucose 6-dehydrogenase
MRDAPVFSVVGLGKMGMPLAAAIASRGFDVIGVDTMPERVEALNGGPIPGPDAGMDVRLAGVIRANAGRLRGTGSHREAVAASDVSLVVVPTPSDERGAFALGPAQEAFRSVGRALAAKSGRHLVVLVSTVLPGSTRQRLVPVLERASGKRCGPEIGLCYSPIFAALGSVVDDFLSPDFIVVGEFDEASGDELARHYRGLLRNEAPVKRMSLENAEIAKLAVNAYVTTKITFANLLAAICERLPDGDVDVVADAMGADRRIGRDYLTGGLGYGGPCFPRDNNALRFLAESLGVSGVFPQTVDRLNRSLTGELLARLPIDAGEGRRVAVVGLSYKPDTAVVDDSPGIHLARQIARRGARVVAYDPLASVAARAELGGEVRVVDSIDECLRDADLVLLTTPGPVSDLDARALKAAASPVTVVDFWRTWPEFSGQPDVIYVPVGRAGDGTAGGHPPQRLWSA